MNIVPYASDLAGHLTQLYSETKKSALSNVTRDTREDATPALTDLHRKFRIQKDRLITWGLEWSDEGKGADGDIDGSVARAGLTETVTSVLENIKEVLQEAERIRSASTPTRAPGWAIPAPEKSTWLSVDPARYRELVTDLTTSIDILYDLSRNRRALVAGSHPSFQSESGRSPYDEKAGLKSGSSVAVESPFSNISYPPEKVAFSRRLGLPSAINISALILPEEGPPPYQHAGIPLTTRMIGRLLRSQAPEDVRLYLQESLDDPLVLIEYANFDSIYRESNMSPPLKNLELLSDYLQQAKLRPQLSLLGYFEDPHTSRLGLIYDLADCLPEQNSSSEHESEPVEASSLLHLLQTASKTAKTHETLTATPPLEERFRLAFRVAEHVQCMHYASFIHRNLTSDSIVFVTGGDSQHGATKKLKTPVIGAFDLFSSSHVEAPSSLSSNIYRHPDDQATEDSPAARLRFDVYGLGLTLLEIGLWTPLSDLHKAKYQLKDFKMRLEKIWIPRLAVKCGSLYMSAVQACFNFSDSTGSSTVVSGLYDGLVGRLRQCCLLCGEGSSQEPFPSQSLHPSATWPTTQNFIPRKPLSRSATPRQQSDTSLSMRPSLHPSQSSVFTLASPQATENITSTSGTPKAEIDQKLFQPEHGTRGLSFREIRRRVVLIQTHWRQRRQRMAQVPANQAERLVSNVKLTEQNLPVARKAVSTQSKQRAFPIRLPPQQLAEWHSNLGLRISHIVERALKNSLESSTIDLVSLGHDEASARPTILVTCTSTAKVKAAIKHRFQCDTNIFDVKVRKGTVGLSRRCGRTPRSHLAAASERVKRSHAHMDYESEEEEEASEPQNPYYHPRPICGSSIGAYNSDEGHLMPVSFGGIVLVDDQPFGMSVHHMLEPESDDEDDGASADVEDDADDASDDASSRFASDTDDDDDDGDEAPPLLTRSPRGPLRSSARQPPTRRAPSPPPDSDYDADSSSDIDFSLPPSSTYSSSFASSTDSLPLEDDLPAGPVASAGDTRGFSPSATLTSAWRITQPALLDAQKTGWHPLDQDQLDTDADHLASFELGALHASSGLRRHRDASGLLHEIDWALFSIKPSRLQGCNVILGGRAHCAELYSQSYTPKLEAPFPLLPVLAMGRTSGLATAVVNPGISLVKLYGRRSFSSSWTVLGDTDKLGRPFGVAGDSGAWIVDHLGRVVGVVLAHKNDVTYFCPMDVVLEDVSRALSSSSASGETSDEAVVMVELPGQRELAASPSSQAIGEDEDLVRHAQTMHIGRSGTTAPRRSSKPTPRSHVREVQCDKLGAMRRNQAVLS
ncbi:hypothetical protein K461DRAFT_249747 [Myriangium duriaei CBS 260.36]|uniref:Protein kinase domain-containing protein n=1 Tax=Myriangium duriaei CBS 260.36 TaxID=1168546 RepID=A0A9P4MJD6_9PEZI|nr:hypothetical protein K461DRAFT_249747 [Myriangium duriaei CBS 260.36]